MHRILVVSHCILNTASKVTSEDENSMRKETEARKLLLNIITKQNIQLLQLPCPEFIMYGPKRWGHVKDQFNHSFFRTQCREMLLPYILQLKEYASLPDKYQIIAVVAVDGSPSCGYSSTCIGDWGGELCGAASLSEKLSDVKEINEPGVFMEELLLLLQKEQLNIPVKDLSQMAMELADSISSTALDKAFT